ncbi:MAG: hypothetical protein JSU05_00505 [Bacteroidetes bacterium]|nr:hypothetical protein [Bacteroidota bacterium]
MNIISRLTTGWTLLKIVRVTLGVLILSSGLGNHDMFGVFIGILFTLFSLFNSGICCAAPYTNSFIEKTKNTTIEDADYEEVVSE